MRPRNPVGVVSLIISLLIILSVVSACSPAPSTPSTTQTPANPSVAQASITLTASCYLPSAHMLSGMMGEMMKEVESLSNGRVKINYQSGGSILTGPKTADGILEGLADIGVSHIGYTPGRFPVTEALDLPIGYSSSWVGTNIAADYLARFKPREWDKYHLLLTNGTTTAAIVMARDPVRKLEDLKGKTMRGAGEVADALAALGATPRDMPMIDVYEAMSKGAIDGLLISAETLKSFKLADVTKYTTYVPSVGNQYVFYMAVNADKWNSLPPDIQTIFTGVAAKYQPKSAAGWNEINALGFEAAIKQGAEFITLSDEEAARWKQAVQPVMENYVKKMAGNGFSEQETRDHIAFIKERMAYWDQEQIKQNIPSEAYIKK
jgi:TRAP-type transport system periplasmic protein